METSNIQIDENLYSRQLYVIGVDAMKRLAQASVLISGLGGLGVEIAKNVILAGTKNVTIQDTQVTTLADLSSQFYLSEDKIGQNRALACREELSSLNEYVSVNATTEPLTEKLIAQFNCLVITEPHPQAEIFSIANFCRTHNIKLILTQISGVFGYVFNDFGPDFVSSDALGNEPSRFQLGMVTRNEKGLVTIAEGETMDLQDGDTVRFEEVEGMTELNTREFEVTVKNHRSFYIGNTSSFGEYQQIHTSGTGVQVIKPKPFAFKPLPEALVDQERFMIFDEIAWGRDQQVILAFFAAMSAEKAEDIPARAQEFNAQYKLVETIDEKIIAEFSRTWQLSLSPMAAIFGGIAGQEVIKALGCKFTPVFQFLGTGFLESLATFSTKDPETAPAAFTKKGDRYDAYRAVFGDVLFEKLAKMRYFMVGAGALGCEMLKNWAMMGVGTDGGLVMVTDHDTIEKSNLNRQFLFRKGDIGCSKSESAARAVQRMNPAFRVEGHQNFVGDETRKIYNDAFYHSLGGICNALDNVKARRFMDSMSALYHLPLLESGTLGTKASFQMVVPGLTEQYSDTADPDNLPGVALCTLTNSPTTIPHCCEWAKVLFEKQFVTIPETVNKFFAAGANLEEFTEQQVRFVSKVVEENAQTWEDCIDFARALYDSLFKRKLEKLLALFPPDSRNTDGTLYWSHGKREPHPLPFDLSNPRMARFVLAAATIRARILGIAPGGPQSIQAHLQQNSGKGHKGAKAHGLMTVEEVHKWAAELLAKHPEWQKRVLRPEPFEKDSEDNLHMEFMEGAVNLRAENYMIQPATKLEVKKIVGNIIPAIATTTAMVTGFVCMEMYKVHSLKPRPLDDLRSGLVNLGGMSLSFWPPYPAKPKKVCKANGMEYDDSTVWTIEGNLTVKEFIEKCAEKYKLEVTGIVIGTGMVYMDFPPYNKSYDRNILEFCVETKLIEPPGDGEDYITLSPTVDDEEVEIPTFRLKFRNF